MLVKRLALLAALVVLATGCHFPQGWHWPRTLAATGSGSTQQTVVYFQNDVVNYQWWLTQWIATELDAHPELAIKLVASCPAGRNCVVWRTVDMNYNGLTNINVPGADRHLTRVTVSLDPVVGRENSPALSRAIAWYEACHALGGGWGEEAIQRICRPEYRAHHMADVARVYHDDTG